MKGATKGLEFNDRKLAGELRTKTMQEIFLIVNDDKKVKKFSAYKKAMLLVLAKSILPRLNELTGENGGPLVIELPKEIIEKNGLQSRTS